MFAALLLLLCCGGSKSEMIDALVEMECHTCADQEYDGCEEVERPEAEALIEPCEPWDAAKAADCIDLMAQVSCTNGGPAGYDEACRPVFEACFDDSQ